MPIKGIAKPTLSKLPVAQYVVDAIKILHESLAREYGTDGTDTENEHHWPNHNCPTVKVRKRDLVIRIANWTRDKGEPAYDVEVYIGGVYAGNESTVCPVREHGTRSKAKAAAVAFAQAQIAKLL